MLENGMQVHGVCVTALLQVPMADIANHPSVCSCLAWMWLQNNPPSCQPQAADLSPLEMHPFTSNNKNPWKGRRGPKKS